MPRVDPEPVSLERGHEPLQTRVPWVAGAGLALAVLIGLFLMALVAMTHWFAAAEARRDTPPSPLASQRQPPPLPRLQTNPTLDMAVYRRQQQALLESYGWVNRDRGLVRVPIEQALRRAAAQGLRPAGQGLEDSP